MSRRARTRRDKRAPIPDFDDPQPRMPGLFIGETRYEQCLSNGASTRQRHASA